MFTRKGYAAGELKHGPLALVDETMPVVALAPNDELLGKLYSNLQEVRSPGGQLFVFVEQGINVQGGRRHPIWCCRPATNTSRPSPMSSLYSCWPIT